ncbi:hypothetical protein GC197_00070 [bacterium]|nr:hypothetical protein [bacterium]
MDTFTHGNLERLIAPQQGPCVSIMMPTHESGEDGQQDRVRLKNLLNDAQRSLAGHWLTSVAARDFIKPVEVEVEKTDFWQGRSQGMAIFYSPQLFSVFRLQVPFEPLMVVGSHFHIKSVLPALNHRDRFYVLTLSQKQASLYLATSKSIEKIVVPNLPANSNSALGYSDFEREVQCHSPMHASHGERTAIFHGHGGEADSEKEELKEYFRQVDKTLTHIMQQQNAPLILAGVEYLLPIYREVNTYKGIVDPELRGNLDDNPANQIREQAYELMKPILQNRRESATNKFNNLIGTDYISGDIHKILVAANQGQIESIFIDAGTLVWGKYQSTTRNVYVHDTREEGDEDLLNLAAIETLRHRGEVFVVPREQMPGEDFIAATYRYRPKESR